MRLKCGLYGWGANRYQGRWKLVIQWVPDDRCYFGTAVDLRLQEPNREAKGLTLDECQTALSQRVSA